MERTYALPENVVDQDNWIATPPKSPRASKLELGDIHGVLPFVGVRNPSGRSSYSHKVFLTYRTAANDWVPKVGIAESSAEAAVAIEALISPEIYDVEFQPLRVPFKDEDGKQRSYTHDLRITFRSGLRRLIFIRNGSSLAKPQTERQITAIAAATPKDAADEMLKVNADDFTRQRRENLMRMHHFVFQPDDEADEAVLQTAQKLRSFYYMKDLFPHAPVSQPRAFAACHRLVAHGKLRANLDNVFWENSRLELAA